MLNKQQQQQKKG